MLIDLHGVDVDATPLAAMNKGTGYVERQISGWSTRFRNAHTEDIGDYETVMAWLAEHQPDDVASCMIHNDFRFDNIVLDKDDPTRPVGVLDWEMATVGDPLMDLGGTMAYWVQDDDDEFFRQFRRQPTNLPGMLSRDEVVDYYCERTGYSVTPEQWRFYEVYGLFRLGVIAQQIYYRYFHEQTTNEAYAIFGPAAQLPRAALPRDHRPADLEWGSSCSSGTARRRGTPTTTTCSRRSGWEQSRLLGKALAARGIVARRRRASAACAGTARPPRRAWASWASRSRPRSIRAGTSSTT